MARLWWWSPKLWKALWIALRRSHRDPKARRNLLRIVAYLVIVFGWIIFNLANIYHYDLFDVGRTLGIILLFVAAVAGVILAFNAIRERIDRKATERNSPAVSPELKLAIFRETCLLATLLERLGSEGALEKVIPPEIEVITRRVLLDRLAALDLRDNLEPWLLDLLLAPDGHWTVEQKRRAIPAWECLAVLRSVLGLGELRPLTGDPRYNIEDARSVFAVRQANELAVLPSWELRAPRDQANNFFQRCWMELVARDAVEGAGQENVERALKVRSNIQQAGYTGDYLVGAYTIAELPLPLLWQMTTRAYNRRGLLALLVEITSGDAPPDRIRQFLSRFFAPPAAPPTAEAAAGSHAAESA
jgi:hypothetical protein